MLIHMKLTVLWVLYPRSEQLKRVLMLVIEYLRSSTRLLVYCIRNFRVFHAVNQLNMPLL